LAVKTASEMTYTVSGGALNSTQSNPMVITSEALVAWWTGLATMPKISNYYIHLYSQQQSVIFVRLTSLQ